MAADHAARAAAVIDNDLLAQRFRETLANGARKNVIAATGRKRHDEAQRATGIRLLRIRNGCEQATQRERYFARIFVSRATVVHLSIFEVIT
jgi:hypothetical protein